MKNEWISVFSWMNTSNSLLKITANIQVLTTRFVFGGVDVMDAICFGGPSDASGHKNPRAASSCVHLGTESYGKGDELKNDLSRHPQPHRIIATARPVFRDRCSPSSEPSYSSFDLMIAFTSITGVPSTASIGPIKSPVDVNS